MRITQKRLNLIGKWLEKKIIEDSGDIVEFFMVEKITEECWQFEFHTRKKLIEYHTFDHTKNLNRKDLEKILKLIEN